MTLFTVLPLLFWRLRLSHNKLRKTITRRKTPPPTAMPAITVSLRPGKKECYNVTRKKRNINCRFSQRHKGVFQKKKLALNLEIYDHSILSTLYNADELFYKWISVDGFKVMTKMNNSQSNVYVIVPRQTFNSAISRCFVQYDKEMH